MGPWTIQVRDKPYKVNALIIIDTASNLVELVWISNTKVSAHIANKYAQVWTILWPARCTHDNGG